MHRSDHRGELHGADVCLRVHGHTVRDLRRLWGDLRPDRLHGCALLCCASGGGSAVLVVIVVVLVSACVEACGVVQRLHKRFVALLWTEVWLENRNLWELGSCGGYVGDARWRDGSCGERVAKAYCLP